MEHIEGLLDRAKTPERREKLEAELDLPPLPWCLVYLWNRFNRLSNRRGSNGFGPSLLSYTEIEAFQVLTGFRFTSWEIEMIEMLDLEFVVSRVQASKEQ